MSKKQLVINPTVLLKVSVNDPYKVELVDNLIITASIKEIALIPFITSLLESLSKKKKTEDPMIPRYVLNKVFYLNLSTYHYQD